MTSVSFTDLFSQALQGMPVQVVGRDGSPFHLPVHNWMREADAADLELLDLCASCCLDIGCGPGRLSAALGARGHFVLGIDIVNEAVRQTQLRGVRAVNRDVFRSMPGEGRWHTALLADGNIGIGGDPVTLLRRVGDLILQGGRVVVEVAEAGVPMASFWANLEYDGVQSRPFRWAVVGLDDIDEVAGAAGFVVASRHQVGSRWAVVFTRPVNKRA